MLQSLAQFRITLLDLLEQSHILDCDHRLVSESRHEFNLFRSKGSNFLPPHYNNPKEHSLPEQWNSKQRPVSSQPLALRKFIFRVSHNVVDVNHSALKGDPSNRGLSSRPHGILLKEIPEFLWHIVGDRPPQ